jgi:predicted dehydrogenase
MSDKTQKPSGISRRSFLKTAATTGALGIVGPTILPGCVTVNQGTVTRTPRPSGKIHIAAVGIGWQGGHNLGQFLQNPDVQVVAVCDLDTHHLARAKKMVDSTYDGFDCPTYSDYREMYEKEDIDAVSLGLPDHWHAIPAIAAAKHGYDVFGEKPFSHSLVEGRAMVDALNANGCIWQTGSWQRSVPNFHRACELVRNGRIGKVHHIEVGLGGGHSLFGDEGKDKAFKPAPAHLDYKTWLGPSGTPKELPYAPARVHKHWRWVMAHGGGQLMDWIGHHGDIAHWGVGLDNSGPIKVVGSGKWNKDDLWDAPYEYDCGAVYENGMTMSVASKNQHGTKFFGEDGWLFVTRGNLECSNPEVLKSVIGDDETRLYKSDNHWTNFTDSIKSRKPTITPAETAHRSASIGHLCNVAMYTGREINFCPKTETIKNDNAASELLKAPYKNGYRLG